MEHKFIFQDKTHSVKVESIGETKAINIDEKREIKIESINSDPNTLSLVINGKVFTACIAHDKEKCFVSVDGHSFTFDKAEAGAGTSREMSFKGAGNTVCSTMPGSLVKLLAKTGKQVKAGETVAIVEAMKMENELISQIDGVVKKINYKEGDQVDAFKPIVELEPG